MAGERDVVVDAQCGFLHSVATLIKGEPYDAMELRDLVLDVEVERGTFSPDIPLGLRVVPLPRTPSAPWQRRWRVRWPISR
jgi:hypothetical protein